MFVKGCLFFTFLLKQESKRNKNFEEKGQKFDSINLWNEKHLIYRKTNIVLELLNKIINKLTKKLDKVKK